MRETGNGIDSDRGKRDSRGKRDTDMGKARGAEGQNRRKKERASK